MINSTTAAKNMLTSITSQQNKLYDLYNQINSKQKYTNISENPIDAADIVRVNKQLSEIDTYARNVENAITQINAQDEVFSTIVEKMQRINELTLQAANSPSGEDGFNACKLEIQELTKSIVDLANSSYDGKYIFAGTNVTTKPFSLNDDGTITYAGTPNDHYAGYERTLDISEDAKIELNSAGDKIFGVYKPADPNDPNSVDESSGLFGVLGKLNDLLNQEPADHKAVGEMIDDVQDSIKHISEMQSVHSTTVARLNMTQEMLDATELTLTSRKASLSEIDLTTAISQLTQMNYNLQASMTAYSMISNKSLLDYI